MTSYNAIVQLTGRYSDDLAERVVDELVDHHPAVSRGLHGHPEVIITVEAETLRQAVVTALALAHAAGHDTYSLEVLPTEAFDQRLELEPVPELLSVAEAAAQLGVSRQAVQQRIDAGTLAARRVGKVFAVPSTAVGQGLVKASAAEKSITKAGAAKASAAEQSLTKARAVEKNLTKARAVEKNLTKAGATEKGLTKAGAAEKGLTQTKTPL